MIRYLIILFPIFLGENTPYVKSAEQFLAKNDRILVDKKNQSKDLKISSYNIIKTDNNEEKDDYFASENDLRLFRVSARFANIIVPYSFRLGPRWVEDAAYSRRFGYGGSFYVEEGGQRPSTIAIQEGFLSRRAASLDVYSHNDISYFIYDQNRGVSFEPITLDITPVEGYSVVSYRVVGKRNTNYIFTYLTRKEDPDNLVCNINIRFTGSDLSDDYLTDYIMLINNLKIGIDAEALVQEETTEETETDR